MGAKAAWYIFWPALSVFSSSLTVEGRSAQISGLTVGTTMSTLSERGYFSSKDLASVLFTPCLQFDSNILMNRWSFGSGWSVLSEDIFQLCRGRPRLLRDSGIFSETVVSEVDHVFTETMVSEVDHVFPTTVVSGVDHVFSVTVVASLSNEGPPHVCYP